MKLDTKCQMFFKLVISQTVKPPDAMSGISGFDSNVFIVA